MIAMKEEGVMNETTFFDQINKSDIPITRLIGGKKT